MTRPLALGIIGHPIGHTLSPTMHTLAGAAHSIPLSYGVFDVHPDRLAEAIAGLRALSADGFNVTVPHKVAVMEYLDEITPDAATIGAVNTVVNVNGKLVGHNTDGLGFVDGIREDAKVDPTGKRVFIYGAGGAARGVVVALACAGVAHITIANRSQAKAIELCQAVTDATGVTTTPLGFDANLLDAVAGADIIVNTTSVGMEGGGGETILPAVTAIRPDTLAVDIVYRPLDTPFLIQARKQGAKTQDGLWMLIRQGDRAFRLWTGGSAFPVEAVRAATVAALTH